MIFQYLIVALLNVAIDGYICAAHQKKFKLWSSVFLSLIWPITLLIDIYVCYKVTKDCPRW